MSLIDGCPQCRSLLAQLSQATIAYHKILNVYELAVLRHDAVVVEKLELLRFEAVARRTECRALFKEHIATHYSSAAGAPP